MLRRPDHRGHARRRAGHGHHGIARAVRLRRARPGPRRRGGHQRATAGNHTATFEINPAAATENITAEDYVNANGNTDSGNLYGYDGPWVTGESGGGDYSSAQPFNIVGKADTLAFVQQPSNSAAGDTIKPPVTVAVQTNGVTDTSATDSITLALASGTGTLAGTLTETAVAGIATFSDLSIDTGGTYTITADDGSTMPVLSSAFDISAGKLVFKASPHNGTAGEALNPAITVELEDGKGKVITTDSSSVVTLTPVGVNGAATITGNTATLVKGVATFSDVALEQAGSYQLQAADGGDTAATSGKFKITGSHLAFIKQPASTETNAPIVMTIALENYKNQIDTQISSDVSSLDLGVIFGTTAHLQADDVPFVNGVATYNMAQTAEIDQPGGFFINVSALAADGTTDSTVAAGKSRPFRVTGLHLVFTHQPMETDVNSPIPMTIALENAKNQIDTQATSDVSSLDLGVIFGTTAQLQAADVPFVNGVATYNLAQTAEIDRPGGFYINVSASAADGTTDSTVTAGKSNRLKFQVCIWCSLGSPSRPASTAQS